MSTIKVKEIIKRLSTKDDEKYEKLVNNIMPTTFCTFYDNIKSTKTTMIELNAREHIVHSTTKINGSFIKRDPDFGKLLNRLGWQPNIIVNYIESKLQYNSNVVVIDKNDEYFAELEMADRTFRYAIKLLCDNDILAKTTIKNKYVINHNKLFKGDLTDFAAKYNMLYGNAKAKINDCGKIVADEVIDGCDDYEDYINEENKQLNYED